MAGDRARCRCYFFAPMGRPKAAGGYFAQDIVTNAGCYHDQRVHTERGWRIAVRVCEMTVMIAVLPAHYSISAGMMAAGVSVVLLPALVPWFPH